MGNKIKKLRETYKITQKELAIILDCSVSLISLIEKDKRNISESNLIKLATAFNISINYFKGDCHLSSNNIPDINDDYLFKKTIVRDFFKFVDENN